MTEISTSSVSETPTPFTLTQAAASRISVLLEAEEKPFFRVCLLYTSPSPRDA